MVRRSDRTDVKVTWCSSDPMQSSSSINVCFLILGFVILLLGVVYQPLPENFSQPWKYRFLSYGAARIDHLGCMCEKLGLFNRIDLIRPLHHLSIGLFQRRSPDYHLKVTDRRIDNVKVRIYEPEESIPLSEQTTVIYFHGGGFILGSIETYDQATYLLANLTRATVISVEYRLAPEHRFPSALNDCLAVSRELFLNGIDYRINPNRIILSGDSAGGNLALVVSHTLIDEGHRPYLISLLYPSLQFFDFTLPSYRSYLKRNILGLLNEENLLSMITMTSEKNVPVTREILSNTHTSNADKARLSPYLDPARYLSIDHQLNQTDEQNATLIADLKYLISPSMSPLLVADEQLLRLPPVLLFTTEFDILRDEGFIFAARLRAVNQSIYHHHFGNAFHGAHVFLYGPLRFEIAHQMIEHTAGILRHYF